MLSDDDLRRYFRDLEADNVERTVSRADGQPY